MSDAADYSAVRNLLRVWSVNFVALRYPFERYEGMTAEEYAQVGTEWVRAGAKAADAAFVYHPEELEGLTFALNAELEAWIASVRG